MARNASKAQVAARYKAAGVMQPTMKLEGEELQRHLRQRSNTFASAKGKAARSRANTRRKAIASGY